MTELVGYCFHCSNYATYDEKLEKMVCFAYPNGIPDSMWERVEKGKHCLWRNKNRLEYELKEARKNLEQGREKARSSITSSIISENQIKKLAWLR